MILQTNLLSCLAGGYPPAATGGYPQGYGGLNTATGGQAPNSYPPTTASPYPPTTSSSLTQQNSGTITQEHIHASLYSAVEDKVKKHLREVLAQSQVSFWLVCWILCSVEQK